MSTVTEAAVRGTSRKPTPEQAQGPFYPLTKPLNAGPDLTADGRAKGEIIELRGRVFDTSGRPLAGVQVEVWQANSSGRYTHPEDTNPAPLDPDFAGYGVMKTDADGEYRFRTVKPGAYSVGQGRFRTRHIHFCLTSPSSRLITQMYFRGEPLNESDMLLTSTPEREALIVELKRSAKSDAPLADWDITMWQG